MSHTYVSGLVDCVFSTKNRRNITASEKLSNLVGSHIYPLLKRWAISSRTSSTHETAAVRTCPSDSDQASTLVNSLLLLYNSRIWWSWQSVRRVS